MFDLPTKVIFGVDSLDELTDLMSKFTTKTILFISDQGLYKAGLTKDTISKFTTAYNELIEFYDVEPDPSFKTIEKINSHINGKNIDVIIALGGGSVLDTAKAVKIVLDCGGDIRNYSGMNKVEINKTPLIVLPTTAGTGSEVTCFTVITDSDANKKLVLGGKNIAATYAIIDPKLTLSIPKHITASTGMDALTHAIEAIFSKLSNPIADTMASKAIQLITTALPIAYENPNDITARSDMMLGSLLAGIAFNSAVLGLAHAIAHPMGAFFHIPHGTANAVVLPQVVKFNAKYAAEKAFKIASSIPNLPTMSHDVGTILEEYLKNLNKTLHIPKLNELNINSQHLSLLAKAATQEGAYHSNPVQPSVEDIEILLSAC